MTTMKALVKKHAREGLWLEDVPLPEVGNNDVLIKVHKTAICAASIKLLDMLSASTALRDRLEANTRYFREGMQAAGFSVPAGDHPIVPVMLGDAVLAQKLLERGIYAVGFFYPVVPKGKAPIRTQISAAHTRDDLDTAIAAFAASYAELRRSGGGGTKAALPGRDPPNQF